MDFLTTGQAGDLIDEMVTATNHGVYETWPHNFNLQPFRVYFYFVTNPLKTHPDVKLYIYDHNIAIRGKSMIRDIITPLARAAASDDPPTPCSTKFEEIPWTRKSYLAFMIYDPRYTLNKKRGIVFDPSKGTENHTFFEADSVDIEMSEDQQASRKIPLLYFKNFMAADEFGNFLDRGERQEFNYILFPEESGPEEDGRVYAQPIDPGGTNLGPPVPPL